MIINNIFTNLSIEILEPDKIKIPLTEYEDFIEWIKHKALTLGTGKHNIYYSYTDDFKQDINITIIIKGNLI